MSLRAALALASLVFCPMVARAETMLLAPAEAAPPPLGSASDSSLRLSLGPTLLVGWSEPHGGEADHAAATMATGELLFDLALSDHFGFEIGGRFGVTPSSGGTALVALGLGFRAGMHFAHGLSGQTSVRVLHIHDAPHDAWTDATGATLAGDPTFGLAHVTAAGAAIGIAWELPGTDRRLLLTLDIEVLGRVHGHGSRALPGAWVSAPVGLRWRI